MYSNRLTRLTSSFANTERTDIQTDRRSCHSYYSALHCMQCSRAVKIIDGAVALPAVWPVKKSTEKLNENLTHCKIAIPENFTVRLSIQYVITSRTSPSNQILFKSIMWGCCPKYVNYKNFVNVFLSCTLFSILRTGQTV